MPFFQANGICLFSFVFLFTSSVCKCDLSLGTWGFVTEVLLDHFKVVLFHCNGFHFLRESYGLISDMLEFRFGFENGINVLENKFEFIVYSRLCVYIVHTKVKENGIVRLLNSLIDGIGIDNPFKSRTMNLNYLLDQIH